jgi:acetylglutamate kinase
VRPSVLEGLLDDGFVPVLSTLGVSDDGRAHNVNADDVAGAVAGAMEAEKVVYLTDIEGVRSDPADAATLVSEMDAARAEEMIASGAISGGMIPKVRSCLRALAAGARGAHILDGRVPHALLLELFTDAGVGTMIVGEQGDQP